MNRLRCWLAVLSGTVVLISSTASANLGDEVKKCMMVEDRKVCVAAAEASWLAKHSTLVKKTKNGLQLVLANGKLLKLEDKYDPSDEADIAVHDFYDYFKDIGFFLIRINKYESYEYLLIGRRDGYQMKLDNVPVFSPDREHFITVSFCPSPSCTGRLQIWRTTNVKYVHVNASDSFGGAYELMWSFSPYEYWTEATPAWIDNSTIKVIKLIHKNPVSAEFGYVEKFFFIKLDQVGWKSSDSLKNLK